MNAKEYFEQVKKLDAAIDRNLERLQEIRSRAEYKPPSLYSGTGAGRGSGASKDWLINNVCSIVELEEKIEKSAISFELEKQHIIDQLLHLQNGDYIQVLCKRYIDFKPWRQISVEMDCSESYLKQLHRNALAEFERLYSDSFKKICL